MLDSLIRSLPSVKRRFERTDHERFTLAWARLTFTDRSRNIELQDLRNDVEAPFVQPLFDDEMLRKPQIVHLQRTLFPEGLRLKDGRFGTAVLAWLSRH